MIHIAIGLLVRDGRGLLGHRHPARAAYPDRWDLIGGHVEPGETAEEALRRECAEEIGVVIGDLRPSRMTVADPGLRASVFVVTTWQGEPSNRAPDEHDDLRWFTADQVGQLDLAHPTMRLGIIEAVRESVALR